MLSLIAIVDEGFGLGKNNALLCHCPADLKRFKSLTLGKPVIMGRKTYEAIGKPLPNRMNIVLSHHAMNVPEVYSASSYKDALKLAGNVSEVMIIGGAQIYAQTIEKADHIYLTQIHHRFDADVFFPTIDPDSWQCIAEEFRPKDDNNHYDMTFYEYKRKQI